MSAREELIAAHVETFTAQLREVLAELDRGEITTEFLRQTIMAARNAGEPVTLESVTIDAITAAAIWIFDGGASLTRERTP